MTLDTPQEIDKALRSRALDVPQTVSRSNGHILRARVALFHQRRPEMIESLHELESYADVQARGLSILLCAQLGLHDDALRVPFSDDEVNLGNLDDQDGAYWAHLGRTAAFVAHDQSVLALEELGMARVYATRIGIQEHIEYVMGERQRIAGNAGIGCAEKSLEVLNRMRPGTGMHRWHEQTYLTDRLAEGNYAMVAHRDFQGRPAQLLAQALLGTSRSTDTVDHPLARAADMFWALREGRVPGAPMSGAGMVHTYTRIAAALYLGAQTRTARQAVAILGEEAPRRLDQRLLWAAAQLLAFMAGAEVDSPLELQRLLNDELGQLREITGVLDALSAFAPEVVLLLSVGPSPHPGIVIAATALPLDELPALLAGQGARRSTNVGLVQRGIDRMITAAGDAQRLVLARQWAQAHATLDFMLPESGNVAQSVHCASPTGGARVKA